MSFGELASAEIEQDSEREGEFKTANLASKVTCRCGLESPEGGLNFPNMEGSTFIRGASGWSLWTWGNRWRRGCICAANTSVVFSFAPSERNEETRALKGTAALLSGHPATKNTAVPSPSTGGRRHSF